LLQTTLEKTGYEVVAVEDGVTTARLLRQIDGPRLALLEIAKIRISAEPAASSAAWQRLNLAHVSLATLPGACRLLLSSETPWDS